MANTCVGPAPLYCTRRVNVGGLLFRAVAVGLVVVVVVVVVVEELEELEELEAMALGSDGSGNAAQLVHDFGPSGVFFPFPFRFPLPFLFTLSKAPPF